MTGLSWLPEQRCASAMWSEAQRHSKEMAHKNQMPQSHQRAANTARFQPGERDQNRLVEISRCVEHGHALQPATDRQADDVDPDTHADQPEMQLNQPKIGRSEEHTSELQSLMRI